MLKLGVVISVLVVYSATARDPASVQYRDGQPKVVRIADFRFQPEIVTVPRGATVEWKNADIVPHSATSVDKKAFDSRQIPTGGSWHVTVKEPGTFEYQCTLHPNMKGTLVVR
ncbi:MAG: cupredoxin family copper-binding protein [Bryobacteraceae bacterium]